MKTATDPARRPKLPKLVYIGFRTTPAQADALHAEAAKRNLKTSGMVRMAELALGARFPAALQRAVARCGDDDVAKVGIHWATEQCRDLLDNNVRGIHFYTLNKSDATRQIYANLGVKDSTALRKAV